MRTKNISLFKYGAVLFLAMLIIFSCKRTFLDKAPYDQISNDNFWNTEDDALMALTGVYAIAATSTEQDFLSYTTIIFNEQKSDNAFETPAGVREMYVDGTDNPTNSIIGQTWKTSYVRIGRANFFLDNIDRVKMDEGKKNIMKAEARFIRAVYYFYMSQSWGDVPLVKKVLTIDEANHVSRTPKDSVVDFVLSELTDVASILPVSRPKSERGRATKGAALAFKGRMLMAAGKWADAAATYKSIMDLNTYSLEPDYAGLFVNGNQDSPEMVFAVEYLQGATGNQTSQAPYRLNPIILGGVSQIGPQNDLVDAYECTDGKSIAESPLYDPQHPYEKAGVRYRDPRLYYSIMLPNYTTVRGKRYVTHPDSTNAPDKMPTYSKTGYGYMKFIDTNYTGDVKTYGVSTPIIRYAEVLLSYLESALEAGEPITQSLLDQTINAVRARPSVNMPPVTETDPVKLREIVRNERRIELALEGIRNWDLIRWHIAHINLHKNVYGAKVCEGSSGCGFQVDAEGHYFLYTRAFRENVDYLWPIPQSELDINPNLTQNPGY